MTALIVASLVVGASLLVAEAHLASYGLLGIAGVLALATGGVLAPMLTHFVWGLMMVLALPPMFGVR